MNIYPCLVCLVLYFRYYFFGSSLKYVLGKANVTTFKASQFFQVIIKLFLEELCGVTTLILLLHCSDLCYCFVLFCFMVRERERERAQEIWWIRRTGRSERSLGRGKNMFKIYCLNFLINKNNK